ncbi:DUF4412 domain-containing protein [Maribacter polysiphoniae]|uniref:DUF4412 domain-containing protein n=1 Tax=Maribacter polysiphoniae TaxID=429344 RepID=A0A316DUX9_9FLAO|nr:DUF4412 domain-containing protein [Maribacter polysiphoniae]MBD1262183.1 DUF4412 domain-containing protein [Maribacter polysiphoniae]PWK21556.1 uncharacterized protein DUF4412 [Maribacter polysiphoniae]
MKTKTIVLLLLFMGMGLTTQAQFFKKLKERAKDAAEETILRKSEEKVAQETDQTMEKIFNMRLGKGKMVDPSVLPPSYDFNWRYTLEMATKEGNLKMHYYLNEGADYFGNQPEIPNDKGPGSMGNMFMVFDMDKELMVLFMDNGSEKTGMAMGIPKMDEIEMEQDFSEVAFNEIGTKEILGYTCQGFEMDGEEYHIVMFVAFDTPVSFNNYKAVMSKNLPKGFNEKWLDKVGGNSLMMEMTYTNKKKSKLSGTMTCVALENETKNIPVAEYSFEFQKGAKKAEYENQDDY